MLQEKAPVWLLAISTVFTLWCRARTSYYYYYSAFLSFWTMMATCFFLPQKESTSWFLCFLVCHIEQFKFTAMQNQNIVFTNKWSRPLFWQKKNSTSSRLVLALKITLYKKEKKRKCVLAETSCTLEMRNTCSRNRLTGCSTAVSENSIFQTSLKIN